MRERLPHGRGLAVLAVLAAACCWATTGTSFLLILDRIDIDGVTVSLLRAGGAALVLWAVLLLEDRSALRIAWRDLPLLIGYGLWSCTLFYIATIYGFAGTSASVGTTMLYIAPAIVTICAALWLDEPLTGRKVAALGMCFGGIALVMRLYSPSSLAGTPSGLAIALVAAIAYAGYTLFGKPLVTRLGARPVVAYYLLIGAISLFGVKAIVSPGAWPSPRETVLVALFTGVVTTLLPTSLYLFALNRLPSSEASILATLEPVVSVALAATLLGERLDHWQLAGAGAVVSGVVLLNLPDRRARTLVEATQTPAAAGADAGG
ncbi:MAG: EamA family transporter [Thermomicrobiales bacterium]|nr:EamA family transporter [Thermomicrobiales bacterium]